jgi:hypothetical protein
MILSVILTSFGGNRAYPFVRRETAIRVAGSLSSTARKNHTGLLADRMQDVFLHGWLHNIADKP